MKKLRFFGWYAIGLLIIIVLLISWCSRLKEVKEPSHAQENIENTIKTEFKFQETSEHIQDSIFTSQHAIKTKQHKLPRTSKVLPKRSEMDSSSTFKVEGNKVISDTNDYDSLRRILIYKELLNDSLIETTNDLKCEIIKERSSRSRSDSAFKVLLILKDEEIDSLSVETKNQYNKGIWKGRKQGLLFTIPALFFGALISK